MKLIIGIAMMIVGALCADKDKKQEALAIAGALILIAGVVMMIVGFIDITGLPDIP